MKHPAIALVAVLTSLSASVPGSAHADPEDALRSLGSEIQEAWSQASDTGAWVLSDGTIDADGSSKCSGLLAQLRAAKVPGTATFTLQRASRDLGAGAHNLADARRACDQIDQMIKIKAFEKWAYAAADMGDIGIYENCQKLYAEAIAAGVPATAQVPARKLWIQRQDVAWSGSIEELRIKYCDAPLKEAEAKRAEEQAPYRKVLKHDKLDMALAATVPFTIAGGESTWDPRKLAAASVWFDALSDQTGQETCAGGVKRKTLRRYAFDRQGKLVKTTEKAYCGAFPASAFR